MGFRPFSWGHFGIVPDPPEPPEDMDQEFEVGDWIKCYSQEDMIDMMNSLAEEGITAQIRQERFGEKGFWLEIEEIR